MFTNGKNLLGQNPQGDFKVITPENSLLSEQAVTSKGIPVHDFNHQLEKVVGNKVLQFIHKMKIKKMFGHKTLQCTNTTTYSEEMN